MISCLAASFRRCYTPPPRPATTIQNTHAHKNTHSIRQWRPWFCLPHARLGGMDAVSELMEQGEHRLAVNRRRWRRDQGALEAPLCVRTTAGYCHHGFFWKSRVIFSGESCRIFPGSSSGIPLDCFGCSWKVPSFCLHATSWLIHQVAAENMPLIQTRALMIWMCQKVP